MEIPKPAKKVKQRRGLSAKTALRAMSKKPQKSLMRAADKLWSEAIRLRDKGICQRCGKIGNNPHHLITRSVKHTRHLTEIGVLLCSGCHTLKNDSAHKGPEDFREWLIRTKGEAFVARLQFLKYQTVKADYNLRIIELKAYLQELRHD